MKKHLIKFLLITFGLFLSIDVSAASLSFDGTNTIDFEKTVGQKINFKPNGKVVTNIDFRVDISDSSNVSLGIIKDDSVAGTVNLTGVSKLTGDPIVDGTIATLNITNNNKLSTSGELTIKLTNIVFTFDDDTTEEVDDISKKITLKARPTTTAKPLSNESKLLNITFSQGKLTPEFKSDVKEYKVFDIRDTIKTITINPTCDHCTFTIKCELGCNNDNNKGRPNLVIGKNIIKITTVSESGLNKDEYLFTVYRGETTDNSAYLSNIEIEDFNLNEEFDKKTLDYTLSIPYEMESLDINAIPEDSTATIEIRGNENLLVGENVITITVTSSETNDKSIYNITVTRLEKGEEEPVTEPVTEEVAPIVKKENQTLIIILIIIGALTIIGISAYFLFFRKKKNKKVPVINEEKKEEIKKEDETISQSENELLEELVITEEKTKPSVDEALADLMTTKEILLKEE